MWRRLLSNINENHDQTIVGGTILAIGIALLRDRNYFYWPPEWTLFMNDKRLDLAIILLGLLITVDSMFKKRHRGWRMFILILGAWTLWFLIGLQLGHAIGVGEFRMDITVIVETAISLLCLYSIYQSQRGGSVHDVTSLIYVLGTLIEAAATFLAVTHTSHKEDTEDVIKNLKVERDNFKQDYLFERKRRLELEAKYEELKKKLENTVQCSFFIERIFKLAQFINFIKELFPYIVILAVGIVAAYPYAKQHNPAFADKMKWLYDVAQYIVTQQATHTDITGAEKKQAATDALLEQAKASKAKITKETAEGMIEKAYQEGATKNETK